jgi:hypothetical protein
MNRRILFFAMGLLLMLPAAGMEGGKLDVVGIFGVSGAELKVATYTDGAQKVGLLGIAKEKHVSYSFRPGEWDSLVQLFQKAAQTQSESWQFIGTIKEVGTKDPTLMLVTAGKGVRFTLETAEGSFSIVLAKTDFERFETSLHQVGTYLTK